MSNDFKSTILKSTGTVDSTVYFFKLDFICIRLTIYHLLVSTSDWDDHIFAHSLEDQAISDTAGSSLLAPVTLQQGEQYDMPLVYSHNDQLLAQELEKQVGVCFQM